MKSRILLLLCLLSFLTISAYPASAACFDPRAVIAAAKDPNNRQAIVAMHRGLWIGGNRLPENSMDSFIAADRKCIPAIESDVRLTKDHVPIMLHDMTYGRTTDVYKYAPDGTMKFYPETNNGYNPATGDLNWADDSYRDVSHLKLLIRPLQVLDDTDPDNETRYPVESVKSFYKKYYENRMSVVVFLEIKDKDALSHVLDELYQDRLDYNHGLGKPMYATEFTVLKFEAKKVPTPEEYRAAVELAEAGADIESKIPAPLAFPSYTDDDVRALKAEFPDTMKDPYAGSIQKWIDDESIRIGIEINLKAPGGSLQKTYDRVKATGKIAIGTFHALPDYPLINPKHSLDTQLINLNKPGELILARNAFYKGATGACCYQLKDFLDGRELDGVKDLQDLRGDPSFIVGPHGTERPFTIITTDDYTAIFDELYRKGAESTVSMKLSPLASTYVLFRNRYNETLQYNYLDRGKWLGARQIDGATIGMYSPASVATINGDPHFYFGSDEQSFTQQGLFTPNGWYQSEFNFVRAKDTQPRAVQFQNSTYVFGIFENRLVYTQYTNGTWQGGSLVDLLRMTGEPAPVVYRGELYVFHKGGAPTTGNIRRDLELWYSKFDGRTSWSTPVLADADAVTGSPPSAVVLNGKLYIIYNAQRDPEKRGQVYCSVFDGLTWTRAIRVPDVRALGQVSPTVSGGNVVMYYLNDDHFIYSVTIAGECDAKTKWGAITPVPATKASVAPVAY